MIYLFKNIEKRWFCLHELGSITSRMARQGLHRRLGKSQLHPDPDKHQKKGLASKLDDILI